MNKRPPDAAFNRARGLLLHLGALHILSNTGIIAELPLPILATGGGECRGNFSRFPCVGRSERGWQLREQVA